MTDLQDAINMVRFGDPVKAIEAFNRGGAAAENDDPILPGEHVFTTPEGIPVRAVVVDGDDPS
jgi:hypothetical protein